GAVTTTVLNLATGMLAPTSGSITVLGGRPAANPAQLAKVGFVAQDSPTYAGLSVADHLQLGARLNPNWDPALARQRIGRLGVDPARPAGPRARRWGSVPPPRGGAAVGRPARPPRPPPGHRQTPPAADPGRAGGRAGPA